MSTVLIDCPFCDGDEAEVEESTIEGILHLRCLDCSECWDITEPELLA